MDALPKSSRVLKVVELLKSGRRYEVAALAAALGVSRRTVYRDLTTLRSSGIWVEYDDSVQGFFIVKPDKGPHDEDNSSECESGLSGDFRSLPVDIYSPKHADELRQRTRQGDSRPATLSDLATELHAIDTTLAKVRRKLSLVAADIEQSWGFSQGAKNVFEKYSRDRDDASEAATGIGRDALNDRAV